MNVSAALRTSAVVALVLATVWIFWPATLGGATTYVTTYGASMEPDFSAGDLALLSRSGSYSVGEVIAYRSASLDTIVMHRIVAEEAGHFVTQGDNNDWLDEDRPAEDEVLGELFFSIPQGGTALDALRSPGVLAPLIAVVVAALGATRRSPVRHGVRALRRRLRQVSLPTRSRVSAPTSEDAAAVDRTDAPVPTPVRDRRASLPVRAQARQVALGAGAVTLVAAVACAVLLAIPTTTSDTTTLQVTQEGRYSYTGSAAAGTTYPTGAVDTGDTVWSRLVEDLTVTLTSTVAGADAVSGALRLEVEISAPDGWTAVVTSGSAAPFQDGTATAAVAVDTEAAFDLLSRHYDEIGAAGGSATLTVTPVSDLVGTVRGQSFTADAPAGLAFTLDEVSLRPSASEPAAYAPSTPTEVAIEGIAPRQLTVLALTVPIGLARTLAGASLLAALITFCAAAWVARLGRGGIADTFVLRHADRILPVTSINAGATVIDVSDAESLHRVAERFDTVVLHHAGEDEDVFAVRDVDATYRFVVPAGGRRGKPPVPAPERAEAPEPEPATDLGAPLAFRGLFA